MDTNGALPPPEKSLDADDELLAVAARYARRPAPVLYGMLRPEVIASTQEWQAKLLAMMSKECGFCDDQVKTLRLVDVGCGFGGHLLDFLRFGFAPENLSGIELLPERIEGARRRLPTGVRIYEGDASAADLPRESQDIVFQSVVFSSLLDDGLQDKLAASMWSWVKPGGGIFWYDFTYDNPWNKDVRGVSVKRVNDLFPDGRIAVRRVTLAPPISRRICKVHASAYHLLNMAPFLRTHVLCWIAKP